MVSKNNQYWKQQQEAQRVPHYGLRKLSIGVASVLLSTTLYMGVTAHADTVTTPNEQPAVSQPTSATTGTSTGSITVDAQPTADKAASMATNNAVPENDASAKPAQTVSPEQPANTNVQPTETTNVAQPAKNLNVESDNNESASESTGQSIDPTALMTNFAVTNQPTDGTHNSDTTTLNTKFEWAIHYTDEAGKKLLPDSVITHDYTRTDTGNQMGNWSYVPNSVKVIGTPNNGWHIDNPNFKFDQAAGGTTFDFATWYAAAASIDGYTPNYGSVVLTDQLPKNPESLHATTTVDSGTHEFTFVYTQRPKTVTINYVNDDDNEAVVKTDSVSGKASTEVTITPQLPKDYMLTPNKDVPSTYTVTDADNQVVTIHVQKQFVDTSATDPQTKQTRTITLHYVYGDGDKQGQPAFDDAVLDVYYHRTATLDRATNKTTYGDWMWDQSQGDSSTPGYHVVSGKWTNLPQTWANVAADVPSIKGYYADLGQNAPTNTNHIPSNTWVFPTYNNSLGGGISEGGKGATAYLDGYGYEVNPTHTIKYMPNKTTVTVNYVDDDNNKAVVGSQHWDGTIGQHIDLTLTPPDNYVLTPGWVNPSSYDFDGVNSSWYTVHVKHATQDVTDQQSKDQISKMETLTRKHLYGPGPHEGEKFGEPDILEVPWHRTATKDLVTNKVSFGDWHVIWDEVKQLSGATKMWGDSEHNWVNGGLIAGHSGYSYLGVGAKAEAITTDGTVIGHGWYWMGEQDIENNPTIVQYYGREKVGVPVNYVDFDTNQQLTTRWLTGDNYLDGNTITLNKDDLTDWGKAVSNNYQLYAKQTLPTTYKIDTVSNDGNLTPITVYVVQPRTVQFTFADNDSTVNGQHPQVGDAASVTGMTGSTTPVSLTVPVGYKLVEGQQLPTTYTFVKGEQNQVILLTHQHTTVQPDAPKTPSDKLPDNPGKNYPSGVAKDDLTKTVTRKVTIVTPDGKQTVTNQTVTFTRNATVDEVTGNVTYGPWSENGKHTFVTVNVPTVAGYTANGNVPNLTVTPDSKDTTVTINYTANEQSTQIVFVDKDGKTIDTVDVNGKTGETVETNAKVPDKWKLVDNETVPSTITFSADTPEEVTVHVEHKIETKQLKIDTNVFLPRLIKFAYGTSFNNHGYQLWINSDEFNSKEFWLGKPIDAGSVTGFVQYDLVTGEIVKVNNGETLKLGKTLLHYPSDDDVANGGYLNDVAVYDGVKKTFVDELNEITRENLNYKVYASANLTKDLLADKDGVISHYFVHDNEILPFTFENGKQYGSDYEIDTSTINNSFSISFNDLIKNIKAFDINENDDGSLSTNARLVTPIAYQPYISKTVTRTINITNPDGTVKTIKQTAEINQNVGADSDWKVHHGDYLRKGEVYVTDNNWSTYEVPTVPGYTASQDKVNAVAVNGDTTDQVVNISYTATKQSVNINYIDINDGNKVVHTTIVDGVTDGDATVTNELPTGYKLVDGQSVPKTVHFNANNNDDINVKVQHTTVTVISDSPKTPSDKLPDNPGKSYPSGVGQNDLNKTVTRTIKVTDPQGKVTIETQTVHLTRTATVDEVTGEVTYGKWLTGQWGAYDVPAVPGYTANQPSVEITPVNANTKDQTVDVSYTPNKQSTTIKYVDNKGEVVHTTIVNGVTDQTVKVSSEVPAGWTITNGQVPSEITFGADGHEPIEVTVAHQHVTVVPDNPQNNGTKLPDNPAKTFNGVEANDLNKTITRTIKVTTPDGQTKTVTQTAKLTRTADVDEVTGEVTYGKWTTGEWASYDVPTVQGYTTSQNEVPTAKVTGDTKDQTVTVTYTADQQKLIVNFIDDTTGQTLKTVNKDGLTNSNSNYNTKSDIQNYVNNHYRLVSDDTNGQNLVFDNDDSKTQTYNVHFAHNTHNINDSNTVTETIHYKLDNGQKAFDDHNAQLSFTRTGYNDEVTGQNYWNDWQATNGQTFNAVQSPSKEGYTPDKTSIEAVNVKPGDKNIDITVTYNSNAQVAKISYIDDTTGRTLKIDNANGKFNQAISFDNNVDNQIQDYEQQGYVLKSNSFSNQAYQADNAKNAFEVHLIHGTKNVQRTQKITETVQYQMEDGTKAPVTNSQSTSFTQDGVQDLVTNNIDWKAIAPHQFKEVITPVMTGYTPDITSIPVITVNFGDKDISKIVTYKANAQTAKISYIDDNTGATLKTDNANGKFNQAISFGDVDGAIKNFEDKGYQLKSNSFKDQKYQADNNSNVFEVHLVHGTKNVQRTQKITETVNYQMDDGSKAPAANIQSVDFTQDGVQDLVTNNIDWKATEPQQFKAVDMPTVTGYTPDITNVPATTVNFGDKNINKVVTYQANAQNATINYIDDTTGKTIKTDNANGKFNQPISFDNNVDNQIKAFENQGYVLKSNSFNGQKYQADNDKNVFEVHLVHGTKNVQRTQKITETINYQMDDGSQALSTNTQSVNFTQNGVQDLVTNNIDWKATESQQFKTVDSPALTGYTPDIASVPAMTVNFGDKDINKTVTYKANSQSAKITYIDDNTGKTLKVDDANGKFNQVIDFANMNSDIKDFENQGYVLKSNSFNGQNYQADNAQNTFEVHFTHGTKNVQRQDTITETVKYQYDNGTLAHENNVQTLNFTQDGVQDLVTKNIDWKSTDAQEFKQVDAPAIDGYTPDITSIYANKVNFGDSDINKVVTYQANNQMANIYYVDDMTDSFIGNGTANGKFGTVIDFGNVNDKINTFKNLGYQLVSNDFSGQTYQSDNSKNVYYVHFTHGIKNIQRNKQITETIKYQYENGQQAQPDSVQTVSFNENGSQDLVTKKINWFNDAPQQFKAVSTPVITGYTADIDNVPAVVVNYDNDNINKVVIYKANSQAAKINYIDDTTGKVIKTDTANGKFNQAISFSETPTNVVNDLIKHGYKLVSNSFNGQTYQNDNSKNEFTVHLAHNTKNVSKQNTVTRTINYLDNDGKAIQTPTVETVTFTQDGITDLVTGNTTWNAPSSQTFEAVTSPTIKGFGKPDVEVVKAQIVNFNDQNVVVDVHYPKVTTPTNVNDNTGEKTNDNTTTPTVDHNKGKLNPTTFTTITHQTTPQAHTANNGGQQSITPQSVNKPSEQQTVVNNGTKANTLPQTGNSDDNSSAIVGLGLLSGMLGLLGIKGKKKQN